MTDRHDKRIRLFRPQLGEDELDAVRAVFRSGTLTDGPVTAEFEQAFARRHGVDHAVALSSGTCALAAMHLALDIGPGDEVIVPSMTFLSPATSVRHVGATPVFADVRADTCTLDAEDVACRITPRTKAVVAMHYGGQAADLDELAAVADHAGIALIEDAAEAHGATYRGRPVGSIGRMAMFSFTPTKNMTTGEGGMVTTDDPELADRLRLLRNHGLDDAQQHAVLGFNWRMSEVQAAIGLVQLSRLDEVIHAKRRRAAVLSAALADVPDVTPPHEAPDRDHVFMLYSVRVHGRRDQVAEGLALAGIESRVYFAPAHRQALFASEPSNHLPITDQLARELLSLPVHPGLDEGQLREVAERTAALSSG